MSAENKPIDIIVSHLPRTHQVKVSWRPDLGMTVSPTGLEGARWLHDNMGWTLPALGAHQLLPYFRDNFPRNRVSFDKGSAALIYEQLEREAATSTLALAEDGDVPDVLSITLKPFQRASVAYLLRGLPRKVLALDTGLGKTAVSCAYARIRQARTMWVTKTSLVNNLKREIHKLTGQRAIVLLGTQPDAHAISILQDKSYQHVIMTYDTLSRSLIEERNDNGAIIMSTSLWAMAICASPFDLLVCDEAHNMKNRNTGRWRVIEHLRSIPSVLLLTATPLVNNGLDFYSLLNILDRNTFGSPAEFTRAYLSADGKRVVSPRKMQQDLLPYMFRRKKTDVLKDLPAKVRQHHSIKLSDDWQKKYDAVLAGIYTDLQGNEYDVPESVLAQINRFRQVVSQAKVNHTAEHAMTLEESGEKCLVFTQWKETAEQLGKELHCDVITGDVPQDVRTQMQDNFNNNPHCRHLVLTLDVGREGLNLTAGTAIVFNDFAWAPMHHEQAEGRAWGRLSDPHGCLVYYVQVEDSIDSFMMETLARKQELIDAGVEGTRSYAADQVSMKDEFVAYMRRMGAK
jgi:SWI/SNF-related matrix-associated actin-dependent regulator 1 of chromatin subfamily A